MKAVIALSGGMDSTTVLAEAVYQGRKVQAVAFSYGSKHNQYENACAEEIAAHYRIPFRLIDFESIAAHFQSNLLKSGGDIPEGHYEAESMNQTVVPGRNLIFISILTGIAWTDGAEEIWLGVHQGDHAIYPDCRADFFASMTRSVELGTDGRVTLKSPFLTTDKTGIVRRGLTLDVPYHLTRTCYKDQAIACGKCGACQERLEAFYDGSGTGDPIEYESREILSV